MPRSSVPSVFSLLRRAVFGPRSSSPSVPPSRRRFLAGCGAAAACSLTGAGAWQPARAEPVVAAAAVFGAPITADVQTIELEWTDTARQRAVPALLYWPAAAQAGGKVPLVVFSHGLGGTRYGYSHLGRYWAEHGYASLHLQHAGSDRAVWSSSMLTMLVNLSAAAGDANAIARAKDVSFGITRLMADPRFGARVDADRIAVAGHSYGANTAMLVAGAVVQREIDGVWQPLDYRDPRVKAAIILSAPPFYRERDTKAILRGVTIPTLHLTGTDDVIRVPGYGSEPADRIAVFDAMPAGHKALAVFNGGTHSIFTDRIDSAGPELNRTVKAATRELSLAFLDAALRGGSYAGVGDWMARRADLLVRHTAP